MNTGLSDYVYTSYCIKLNTREQSRLCSLELIVTCKLM